VAVGRVRAGGARARTDALLRRLDRQLRLGRLAGRRSCAGQRQARRNS